MKYFLYQDNGTVMARNNILWNEYVDRLIGMVSNRILTLENSGFAFIGSLTNNNLRLPIVSAHLVRGVSVNRPVRQPRAAAIRKDIRRLWRTGGRAAQRGA